MRSAVIGVAGMPRSGTTLIHTAIANHSLVDGLVEPYQTRRADEYAETDVERLLADHGIAPDPERTLVVKETTTRVANVRLLTGLLENARRKNIYTGLILILRSPFAAYISQVEASNTMWGQKKLTEFSDETFLGFVRGSRNGLEHLVRHARSQHFRLISYERFCADPANELARLIALVPLRLEPTQLQSSRAPESGAGDPKAYRNFGTFKATSRDDEIAIVKERFARHPAFPLFEALERLVMPGKRVSSDSELLDRLTALLMNRRI